MFHLKKVNQESVSKLLKVSGTYKVKITSAEQKENATKGWVGWQLGFTVTSDHEKGSSFKILYTVKGSEKACDMGHKLLGMIYYHSGKTIANERNPKPADYIGFELEVDVVVDQTVKDDKTYPDYSITSYRSAKGNIQPKQVAHQQTTEDLIDDDIPF